MWILVVYKTDIECICWKMKDFDISMYFCFSVPNNVQEWQKSMTCRSLLAVVLAPVVWDLLVVHRCYRLRVVLLRFSCVRSPSSDVFCSYPWFVAIADKITLLIIAALSLSLAHSRSLQTISYSDYTFFIHVTIKTNAKLHRVHSKYFSMETQFLIVNITYILKIWGTRIFCHCTDTPKNNNFLLVAQTLPK